MYLLHNDFRQSLTGILERYHSKRIFIESSGVADPTSIVPLLHEAPLAEGLKLEKIVTVLDADYWEARENFGRLFYNQLEIANLILLNKVDLLDNAKIPIYLKELHDMMPHCQVIPTVRCNIDPEIFNARPASGGIMLKPMHFFQELIMNPNGEYDVANTNASSAMSVSSSNFVTFSFEHTGIMDETCFNRFIDTLPLEVFRMKGAVQFPDRIELINFVGGKGEWSNWDGEAKTRLAFIGWHVVPETIIDKLKQCII